MINFCSVDFSTSSLIERQCRSSWLSTFGNSTFSTRFACLGFFFRHRPLCRSLVSWLSVRCHRRCRRRRCRSSISVIVAISRLSLCSHSLAILVLVASGTLFSFHPLLALLFGLQWRCLDASQPQLLLIYQPLAMLPVPYRRSRLSPAQLSFGGRTDKQSSRSYFIYLSVSGGFLTKVQLYKYVDPIKGREIKKDIYFGLTNRLSLLGWVRFDPAAWLE